MSKPSKYIYNGEIIDIEKCHRCNRYHYSWFSCNSVDRYLRVLEARKSLPPRQVKEVIVYDI